MKNWLKKKTGGNAVTGPDPGSQPEAALSHAERIRRQESTAMIKGHGVSEDPAGSPVFGTTARFSTGNDQPGDREVRVYLILDGSNLMLLSDNRDANGDYVTPRGQKTGELLETGSRMLMEKGLDVKYCAAIPGDGTDLHLCYSIPSSQQTEIGSALKAIESNTHIDNNPSP